MDSFSAVSHNPANQLSLGDCSPTLVHQDSVTVDLKRHYVFYREYLEILDHVLFYFGAFEEHQQLSKDEQTLKRQAYEADRQKIAQELNGIGAKFGEMSISARNAQFTLTYYYPQEPLPPSLGIVFMGHPSAQTLYDKRKSGQSPLMLNPRSKALHSA